MLFPVFATHNKHDGATDLTKTEFNAAINDHCTAARRNQNKDKRAKKTLSEKTIERPVKPKTQAQINRQIKMKALRDLRKKEKEARGNKSS